MAEFNREAQPVADPQFLHYAKPIGDVKADTSTGLALKGIGDVFEDVVKGVHEGIQAKAGYDLEQQVRPLQDQYVQANQSALERTQTGQSLIDPNTPKAPEGVESNIARAELLHSAKQNGNLTETAYLGKLYSVLKDTRAQYPGFRDYVDKRMSALTGKDVANDYLKSMITDINSYGADKDKDLNHLKTEASALVKEGSIEAGKILNGLHDGSIDYKSGVTKLANVKADHWDLQTKKTALETEEVKDKSNSRPVEAVMRLDMFNDLKAITSQKINGKSTAEWEQAYQAGSLQPGEAEAAIQQINRDEQQFEANYLRKANTNKLSDGRTYAQAAGKEKYDTILNEGKQYFSQLRDRFTNKEYGLAHQDNREVNYINDRNSLALYKGQNGWLHQLQNNPVLHNSPEAQKILLDQYTNNNVLADDIKTIAGLQTQQMATGTPNPDGSSPSLNKALETLGAANKANPNTTPQQEKMSNKALIDSMKKITNPSIPPEMKIGLARAAYNPVQGSVVAKFSPVDGSQESVFRGLFSKDMVDSVWNLNEPQLKDYVKNSAQQWFERDLVPNELRLLSRAAFDEKNMRFAWDPEKAQLKAEFVYKGRDAKAGNIGLSDEVARGRAVEAKINDALRPINGYMSDLKYVMGKGGGDGTANILKILDHARAINPDIDVTSGLPKAMYDAFDTHRKALEKEQQRVKGMMTKDSEKAP